MTVKSYMVIEPTRFNRIHMNHLSPVYKFYHHQLKDTADPTEAAELTRQFCLSYPLNRLEDQLAVLEFLYMNDYFADLKKALSWQHLSKDAVFLYRILVDRLKKPLTDKDYKELRTIKFEHPSLRCIHLFILVYTYYDRNQYAGMDKYTDDIQEALFMINEPLFHYYMKLRFDEMTFHHYWKTNSILLAKKFAYKYLSSGLSPRKQVTMHHHLGLCHTFEGYTNAMTHIDEALKLAIKHQFIHGIDSLINRTIPFLSAVHHKTEGVCTKDPIETAHMSISRGDVYEPLSYLRSLSNKSPFQDTYLGLAEKNVYMLQQATERFQVERNDLFFAQLPELYKRRVLAHM